MSNESLEQLWNENSYYLSYLIVVVILSIIAVVIALNHDNKESSIQTIRAEYGHKRYESDKRWLNSFPIRFIGFIGAIASIVALILYLL